MQDLFGNPYSVGHSGCLHGLHCTPNLPSATPSPERLHTGLLVSPSQATWYLRAAPPRLCGAARPGHTLRSACMGAFTVVPPCLLIFMYPFNAVY